MVPSEGEDGGDGDGSSSDGDGGAREEPFSSDGLAAEGDDDDEDEDYDEEDDSGGSGGGGGGRRGSGSSTGGAATGPICGKRSLSADDEEALAVQLDGYARELDAAIARASDAHTPDADSADDSTPSPSPQQSRQRAGLPAALHRRACGAAPRGGAFTAAAGQCALPGAPAARVGPQSDKLFCGKFSTSGDVFLSACQDAQIRLYRSQELHAYALRGAAKTSDGDGDADADRAATPVQRGGRGARRGASAQPAGPRPYKTIGCRDVGWAVVGADFSPDDKWLAYSSWSQHVHLCNTYGEHEMHEALHFQSPDRGMYSFCLFSIRFSPANTHILGGGSDHAVHLFNIERKEIVARLKSHADDVNAVCFADDTGNVLLSGSDDCSIRVWDVRAAGARGRPVGILRGHSGGITCVSARADGHTLASNSKDQTLKLWDVRAMALPGSAIARAPASQPTWDYRWDMPAAMRAASEAVAAAQRGGGGGGSGVRRRGIDQSLKTFSGHRVLQTLIRCTFSPQHTTGQRYIISGSQCGGVHMWDVLTGQPLQRHPQALARPILRHRLRAAGLLPATDDEDSPPSAATSAAASTEGGGAAPLPPVQAPLHADAVRDVAWHPYLPLVASSSWDCSVGLWTYGRGACAPLSA